MKQMRFIYFIAIIFVFCISRGERVTPITPPYGPGNVVLDLPVGLPKEIQGSILLKLKGGNRPEHFIEIPSDRAVTVPSGEYFVTINKNHFPGSFLIKIEPNKLNHIKVSVIYSMYPLLAYDGFLEKYNCLPIKNPDYSKPFAIFLPGENRAGYNKIAFNPLYHSECGNSIHKIRTPDDPALSLYNVDDQLALFQLHFDPLNPQFPDSWANLEVSSSIDVDARKLYQQRFAVLYDPIQKSGQFMRINVGVRHIVDEFILESERKDYYFKRLEIDHLSLPDQTKLPGYFSLYFQGEKLVNNAPTGTGLDLLPGEYTVEVSAKDQEGYPYFYTQVVNL